MIFVVGGWSAFASIRGAVIAAGTVVVESSKKRVQHLEGGVVRAIHVSVGDRVRAGEVLFELDDTRARSELEIIDSRLFEAEVKQRRLQAENGGQSAFAVPAELLERIQERPALNAIVDIQQDLLRSRILVRQNQENQLREQINHLQAELHAYQEQSASKQAEQTIVKAEINALKTLSDKGLALRQGLNNLRRQDAEIKAELGRLATEMVKVEGRISELDIKLANIGPQFETELLTQMEETSASILDLRAQMVEAMDRLAHQTIRAPRGGFVHELSVHTIGAVVAPGETLLYIVPKGDGLVIEARVRPVDIDQIKAGQPARIRFPAFNTRTTPTLDAAVQSIAADQSMDEQTGERFFMARLILDDGEMGRIEDGVILAGMPAEVMITTNERTALSYLVQPLSDQINRAFREE